MTRILKSALVSVSTMALMSFSVMPAFAQTTLEITNNGSNSDNIVKVNSGCDSIVKQSNFTLSGVVVDSSASTGGNQASKNTGGDVTIDTGDALSKATVNVSGGNNSAETPNCCECSNGNLDVTISKNGDKSFNKVKINDSQYTKEKQKSTTKASVLVGSVAKTGKNKANKNTDGSVDLTTGKSSSIVSVTVTGGTNTLNP